jgi:hypothetical protein
MSRGRCVVCGYARLPQTTAAAQVYQMLTIAALVDKDTDVIERASVTLVTPVAREFVEGLLAGINLIKDADRFLTRLEADYGGGAQKAIRQAYRDLCERYLEMKRAGEFGAGSVPALE